MIRVRWWHWLIAAAVIGAYVAAGWLWAAEADGNLLYNIAAIGSCAAAVMFVAVYTVLGLTGPAKWWRNTFGSALVIAVGSQIPTSGVIAYAVLFHGGLVNTVPLAWALIGGTYLTGLMILALSWMWLWEGTIRRGQDTGGPG